MDIITGRPPSHEPTYDTPRRVKSSVYRLIGRFGYAVVPLTKLCKRQSIGGLSYAPNCNRGAPTDGNRGAATVLFYGRFPPKISDLCKHMLY